MKVLIGVMTLVCCFTGVTTCNACVQVMDDGTYTVDNSGCVE